MSAARASLAASGVSGGSLVGPGGDRREMAAWGAVDWVRDFGLDLRAWQARALEGVEGAPGGLSVISTPRAMGKTWLAAAVALCHLPTGPFHAPGQGVYVTAPTRRQARETFGDVLRFLPGVRQHGDWQVLDGPNNSTLCHRPSGTEVSVLSARPEHLHGLRGSVIVDEPAQLASGAGRTEGDGERLWSAVLSTIGKHAENRVVAVGTNSADPASRWARLVSGESPSDFRMVLTAPDGDWRSPATWDAAYGPDLTPEIRATLEREAADETNRASFEALRLNRPVPDHERIGLLVPDPAAWASVEVDPDGWRAPGPGSVWALDPARGGLRQSVFGVAVIDRRDSAFWRVEATGYVSSSPTPDARRRGDGWDWPGAVSRDEVRIVEGRSVDPALVLADLKARHGSPGGIVTDVFDANRLRDACAGLGLPAPVLRPPKHAAEDLDRFRRALGDGVFRVRRSGLVRRAMAETRTMLVSGGERLATGQRAGRRSSRWDDVPAAMVRGIGHLLDRPAVAPRVWFPGTV